MGAGWVVEEQGKEPSPAAPTREPRPSSAWSRGGAVGEEEEGRGGPPLPALLRAPPPRRSGRRAPRVRLRPWEEGRPGRPGLHRRVSRRRPGTPPRGQRHEEVRAGTAPPPRPTSRPAPPTRAGAWWRGGREDRGYFGNYRWLKTRKSAKVTATSETGATS